MSNDHTSPSAEEENTLVNPKRRPGDLDLSSLPAPEPDYVEGRYSEVGSNLRGKGKFSEIIKRMQNFDNRS